MDAILLLTAIAFLAASIWSAIGRAWPLALIAFGLFLMTINMSGIIT